MDLTLIQSLYTAHVAPYAIYVSTYAIYVIPVLAYFIIGGYLNRRRHSSQDYYEPLVILLWPVVLLANVGGMLYRINSRAGYVAKKARRWVSRRTFRKIFKKKPKSSAF